MHLHLIDGSGYIYRAFYALPPLARPRDNAPVGALYGWCEMLRRMVDAGGCTHRMVVLDGGRSGRNEIDPAYKAQRPPRPPELIAQLAGMEDSIAAWGIHAVRAAGYEADDVIATYARLVAEIGGDVTIHSSDKDLLPLLNIPGVSIYDPLKKQVVTPDVCRERMGVDPHQVTDLLALHGDSSDNIPGVPGIGKKTAADLLRAHGSLEDILRLAIDAPHTLACTPARRAAIASNLDAARKSLALVQLQHVDGLPDIDLAEARMPDRAALVAYLTDMEFNVMAAEISGERAAA